MEKEIKARYRNKLKKIIIEVWNGDKWVYVKTLSDPLIEFKQECLAKVSLNKGENKEKDAQRFSYGLLNEPVKQDTSKGVSIEEAQKELNRLMDSLLK